MITRSDKRRLLVEENWLKSYYGSLINCRVVGIKTNLENDGWSEELWPVIVFENPDGTKFECEISRDEEGNGPGFMFGLPSYYTPESVNDGFEKLDDQTVDKMIKMKWGV